MECSSLWIGTTMDSMGVNPHSTAKYGLKNSLPGNKRGGSL
jgi:hypothetical protein